MIKWNMIIDKIKYALKKILSWLFQSLLWTIISFIFPFSVWIPKIIDLFKTKTLSFHIKDILPLIIFISIEYFLFLAYKAIKKNGNEVDNNMEELKDTSEEETAIDQYKDLDYYFEEYNKHITVYKNGHGILTNSFIIRINNIDSVTSFKRELNVEDGKKSICFPSIKEMKSTNLKYRFDNYCFRCKCTEKPDLIRSVTEEYWTDNSDNGDIAAKNNTKDLKWIVRMNPSAIEIGKPYRISYVISIPGMFSIENGLFKENLANKTGTHGNHTSKFEIKHKIKKFTYTISFEEDMRLHQKPVGKVISHLGQNNLNYKNENNIIYDKYIFSADDLDIGNTISIEWCFRETTNNNGGKMYEKKKRSN